MPRISRKHVSVECECNLCASQYAQGLDELDFNRSACAAAQSGNVQKLESILARQPAQISQDGTGTLSSSFAGRVCRDKLVVFRASVSWPVSRSTVSARTETWLAGAFGGYTPLHYAARNGHLDCVRLLLSLGAYSLSTVHWLMWIVV
jgi:Ankyrin repeat